jgi:hypothetical protein
MKNNLTIVAFCVLVLLSHTSCEPGYTAPTGNSEEKLVVVPRPTPMRGALECGNLDFRYIVTQNHRMSDKIRELKVFMQPEAYSKVNLSRMFSHLSQKFTEPESLLITVETDWERLPVGNQCTTATSGSGPDASENRSHRAKFRRVNGRASFRYNPVLGTSEWVTVALNEGEF